MVNEKMRKNLRFYFLTDEKAPGLSPLTQVEIALKAGATMIQYRHKSFGAGLFDEVRRIRTLCKSNAIPFIVNDDILLAKAAGADGVHLGQTDENPAVARQILGRGAIIGISVSDLEELGRTNLSLCDYIGTGPVFATQTKADAKAVCGLGGLQAVVEKSPLPVVAIGGINAENAEACFSHGAAGVAVISFISRAENPRESAARLGRACGTGPRPDLYRPWQDEFALIDKLIAQADYHPKSDSYLVSRPGDDACLLRSIKNPVISTDTQKEGIHFEFDWQTPEEVGKKAVAVTLSDLAASYARPVCLFINLGLPAFISEETVTALYKGVNEALAEYDCELGGGNISGAAELSIDLFAVGRGRSALFPARSGARPGDGLFCTGYLGLARAGLDCLKRKDHFFGTLLEKFKSPRARFDAAEVLAKNEVACVIDLSDGLIGDAAHVARASGVTVAFDLKPSLFHPDLLAYCQKYHVRPEEMVLAGGEDYELLFACSPQDFERIKAELGHVFPVGQCLPFDGSLFSDLPFDVHSFQHGISDSESIK